MLEKLEIMIMILIIYNVLQKRLISQKYKKCSPGKYALLLYIAVSIRWISLRFDFVTCLLVLVFSTSSFIWSSSLAVLNSSNFEKDNLFIKSRTYSLKSPQKKTKKSMNKLEIRVLSKRDKNEEFKH